MIVAPVIGSLRDRGLLQERGHRQRGDPAVGVPRRGAQAGRQVSHAPGQLVVGGIERRIGTGAGRVGHRPMQICSPAEFFVREIAAGCNITPAGCCVVLGRCASVA